jgi:hypothetical protein
MIGDFLRDAVGLFNFALIGKSSTPRSGPVENGLHEIGAGVVEGGERPTAEGGHHDLRDQISGFVRPNQR